MKIPINSNKKKMIAFFMSLILFSFFVSCDQLSDFLNDESDDDVETREALNGYFTNQKIYTDTELLSELNNVQKDLEINFDDDWHHNIESYIENYRNENGEPDKSEALNGLMLISLMEDNVYPFAMVAIEAIKLDPQDPYLLNSIVAALIRLEYYDLALRMLDYIYEQNPEIFLTFENAAAVYDTIGDFVEALRFKEDAYWVEPENIYAIWNAAQYANDHGFIDEYNRLTGLLPSNYWLQNSDGSYGGNADPKYSFCCPCNHQSYNTYLECDANCDVNLGCFAGYCDPGACCGGFGPFVVGIKICYPPTGLQACITGKSNGTVEIAVQGNLAQLVTVGVKAKLSFNSGKLKTGLSIYGKAAGTSFTGSIDLMSGNMGSSYSQSGTFENGTLGISLSLPTAKDWVHAINCM